MPLIGESEAKLVVWTASKPPLLWRSWGDGEHVVYHRPSGDTHLLNDVSAHVLRALEEGPLRLGELSARLSWMTGGRTDGEFDASLVKLLIYLDSVGLVEAKREGP